MISAKPNTTDTISSTLKVKFRNGMPLHWDGHGMSREEFYEFCVENHQLRIERNANGQLIIMPPTTSETGHRNFEISIEIGIWNRRCKLGVAFDSSTGFTLPNGAERSPDTAWIRQDRWDALPKSEQKKFAKITPDFVVELRSENQSLSELREKMDEYMEAGCRLGWLVDPQKRRTYVYAENGDIQTIKFEEVLSGGEVCPGLEIIMAEII
jgi:Uma2 family endonuclease